MTHAQRAHSVLSASGCKRWWNCPGSVSLTQDMPNESSVFAQEGTRAHELAEACLVNKLDAVEYVDRQIGGHTVTVEMAEAVQVYLDECRRVPGEQWIEVRFNLDSINPPAPMYGTADFVAFDPETRTLHVIDLKFGQGLQVYAEGNPQLRYYALGALLKFPELDVQRIRAVIVQPRAFGKAIRETEIDPVELIEWSMTLMRRAEVAMQPDAPLAAGEWCKFCPAAGQCRAQFDLAVSTATAEFGEVVEIIEGSEVAALAAPVAIDPRTLSPVQIAEAMALVPVVEGFIADLQKVAAGLARQGLLPGWKMVPTRPSQKWADEAEAAGMLTMLHDLPADAVFEPRKPISPAAARSLLAEQMLAARLAEHTKGRKPTKKQATEDAAAALADLIVSASSGEKLVPVADERLALPPGGDEFAT
ncbi:DUF2800 domain-containing protein [Roseomonas sp. USHLN139]|uniref:DUF2800 domain-containing protein n=1 Tax=Roseomonas sp. USHLN139 TaxID=3081298 RepID=UPI003B02960B